MGADMACVILAGGEGKRMGTAERHKVCFPIAGTPAIVRAIDTYKAAGLRHFLVVVGQRAEQVLTTLAHDHAEVQFVYQSEPRGTGHAAAVAVEALAAQGYRGAVMVVMGDKITTAATVRKLQGRFAETGADLVMSTLPKQPGSTAGRVVTDAGGCVLGVVELADIHDAARTGRKLPLAGRRLAPGSIEKRSTTVNASMYVFDFQRLREALHGLQEARAETGNVQGELYLTDTVEWIARGGRVESFLVSDPTDLMAYNTPAELLAVEQAVARREKPPRVRAGAPRRLSGRMLKPAGQWLAILREGGPALRRRLRALYGPDEPLIEARRGEMARLAEAFVQRHGKDRPMIFCRAPGRVNLMGRHVDHRGGYVNVMAISREVLLAAAPRDDDRVTLRNLRARQFPPREFRIFDLLRQATWSDWMGFLSSGAARRELERSAGDWSHYARAPLLRLQHECRHERLAGMDCLVSGDIPMGAGLSSSSALVVAFAEAAVVLNRLQVAIRDFVDLCGEGEWFVGSRGGAADHAAIRTSRAGCISRIGFLPFRLAGEAPLPKGLRLVLAHSGATAVKSAGARDTFNQRVACYELAMMLLRKAWPPAAGVEHLRDLTPEALKLAPGEIYRGVSRLPERPNRRRLKQLLGREGRDRLAELFATHVDLGPYDLRGVALYGICECVRSAAFAEAIHGGDLGRVGCLMRASHDGDRLVRFGQDGQAREYVFSTTGAALEKLARDNADPCFVPGRYACSTEAIDRLVDLAQTAEGVIGAQLAGAGLGGCMMILVHACAVDALLRTLRRGFYRPLRISPNVLVCSPVSGAGLLAL